MNPEPLNLHYPPELPITGERERIIQAIRDHQVVIVAGDTGSGKSTQLPKMCLEAGRGAQKIIGCTQPRRIAATSLAARVAEELGPEGRELVGYKIRFRDRTSRQTRIKFMTDGILLAETRHSRRLAIYDTLIIDEAHERSLNIDFLLGYLKNLIGARPELKLIITSATIDTEKFARHFNSAPVIEVSGRTYPVEVRYQPAAADEDEVEDGEETYVDRAVAAVKEIVELEGPGDILVFMPTERDILDTVETLGLAFGAEGLNRRGGESTRGRKGELLALPLFGRLRAADQNRIFAPHQGRKIVVATNVAETSLTVPGIRYVVDTGLARISTYNVRARTTSLPVSRISRASCEQRQGRCGRVGPGICIRLYSEDDFQKRPAYTLPEIKRANLAEVILRMLDLKLGDPAGFPFIDPPHSRAIRDGYQLLSELGAIRQEAHRWQFAERGRLMAAIPLDPCLSRMIIEARERNALREITIIAAALSISDPRTRPADQQEQADKAHARFSVASSDFLSYLSIWDTLHKVAAQGKSKASVRKFCQTHFLSWQRMREWRDIHEQITEVLTEAGGFVPNELPASSDAIHQAITSGLLRNIAMKKAKNLYLATHNKEVMIFPGSNLFNKAGQWIVAAELVETSRLYARTVAEIKVEWLEALAGHLCRSTYSGPHWEKKQGRVVATEKVTLFGLTLVTGRRVAYAGVSAAARAEARQIFIHEALLTPGELQGCYPFLEHNFALIASLENLEDRFRQRGVVADEQALADFYDQRLPAEIIDQAGLNRLLKQRKSDELLRMREQDILLNRPGGLLEADFPETISLAGRRFKLSYRFAPGADDDGVTVTVPDELLSVVSPQVFEWLVPGLLPEKVTSLLKGLPKAIRRLLIPIPQTARELLAELTPYESSLYQGLEQAIFARFKARISRGQWPIAALPAHLRMRYRVIDSHGRELHSGRNWQKLAGHASPAPVGPPDFAALKAKWERGPITGWDFSGLPESIPVTTAAGWHGSVYPGLLVSPSHPGKQPEVSIRLFATKEECRQATRSGLLALYQPQLPREFKMIKALAEDAAAAFSPSWRRLEAAASQPELRQLLPVFVLEEIFAARGGELPNQPTFAQNVEAAGQQKGFGRAREIIEQVIAVLKERQATLEHISKFERLSTAPAKERRNRFANYRAELAEILPPDFLTTHDLKKVTAAQRHLKALRIRIERAHAAPDKDAAKEALLQPLLARFASWQRPEQPALECRRLLAEYREMLAEFKISLFAQELKTLFPVTAKRLEEKWQELLGKC